ncbi:MAG: beta-galactosidase trimerization domain-containing protein, partial [Candidatus Brocadiaceae bacterium]
MSTADWLYRPNRGIHLTIRDVDCENFDVEAMVQEFSRLKVTFFSFFAGGYVTTYPTGLDLQRRSPWLGERDLTGEIVECAHRHGIKAIPMVDLGVLPADAFEAHPEWAARDAAGDPRRQGEGLYASCPMGGYVTDYSCEIVREIVERYPVDGMKFGGGSYGFSGAVCHCAACAERYAQETGGSLPETDDWADPNYRRYVRWRTARTVDCVGNLVSMVHSIRAGLPVVGNAVCFGDPGWSVSKSLDIERMAERQDAVQVEAQTRAWYEQDTGLAHWQYLKWPAETAAFMTSVCDRPVWVVVSYFCAWPWRRNAVPPTEQKVYLAQIAAHGATPMVNLSGGPPAVHEDRRGFQAIQELYGFLDRNSDLLEGTESAAEVAIVYDHDSLIHRGNTGRAGDLVEEIRGFEEALDRAHVPFDIISSRTLTPEKVGRYRVLVLPNLCCTDERAARRIDRYVRNGGGVVATYQTGLLDREGQSRDGFLLGDI